MLTPRSTLLLLLMAATLSAAACQNAALVSARKEAAGGRYAAAHRDYEAALSHPQKLDARQRREALDGICLTEYLIGAPAYPLERQYTDCAKAAAEPGSDSAQRVAKISEMIRAQAELRVEQALSRRDLGTAIWSVQEYSRKPGANRVQIAQWSAEIWRLIAKRERRHESARHKRLVSAIATLRRENPHLAALSRRAFERWAQAQLTVNGQALFSDLAIKDATLHLWVPERVMPTLALNLDRLSRINDGLTAWCGCAAKTDVGWADTRLPAYLLRLDPDTARSQVLVLAGE